MIDELKPYSETKRTNSRWLNDVPSHWRVQSLRTLIKPRAERNQPDLPLLSVAREKGVFVRSLTDLDENHNVIPEDLTNYKVARLGNLVINKMKAWQGSMGIAPCDGIVSPAYFVFDLGISNKLFAQAMFRSKPYVAHFAQASDGVRVGQWDLSIPGMREIPVLLPPPDEQAAIVRFLNYANGKIERTIRAKRKLIALLNEQKKAIIHRAVTRGLEPNAKLKPSRIPWLGDVPEHWMMVQLRRLVETGRRITYGIVQPGPYTANGRPMVRAQDYSFGWSDPSKIYYVSQEIEDPYRRSRLRTNDIVYSIVGQGSVGNVAVVPPEFDGANITQTTARISVDPVLASYEYVFAVLDSPIGERQLRMYVRGVGQPGLNLGHLKLFWIPLPPREEQEGIAGHLRLALCSLTALIATTKREIALIGEYRTTLTADVVTGKLDVREAAKRLPADAVETLPADGLPELEDDVLGVANDAVE